MLVTLQQHCEIRSLQEATTHQERKPPFSTLPHLESPDHIDRKECGDHVHNSIPN
jgi:hypothetical protein